MQEDDPRLVFVPIEKAIIPPDGLIEHYKDRYWAVHPTKGLVFYSPKKKIMAPQCNMSAHIATSLKKMYPWCNVELIPSVFRRIDPHDYC